MKRPGHVAPMGEMRKPEGKRPLGTPKRKWEDTIKMDLREIVWEGVEWMHLAQDRDQWWAVVNTVMSLRAPYKTEYILAS
jgi:hypothetical protein